MAFLGNDHFPFFQIIVKGVFNLRAEINGYFLSAFSVNADSAIFKIYIGNIKPHTFRYADTRAKQKGKQGQITDFCLLMIRLLLIR